MPHDEHKQKFFLQLEVFQREASKLLQLWQDAENSEGDALFFNDYPFNMDFQELVLKIDDWKHAVKWDIEHQEKEA